MKKYLLGLFAVAFALVAVSFTSVDRANEKIFKFDGSVSDPLEVADPHLWTDISSVTCSSDFVRACAIRLVPDTYYHERGTSGVFELNNSTDAVNLSENEMQITAAEGTTANLYLVSSIPTGSGTIDNKN